MPHTHSHYGILALSLSSLGLSFLVPHNHLELFPLCENGLRKWIVENDRDEGEKRKNLMRRLTTRERGNTWHILVRKARFLKESLWLERQSLVNHDITHCFVWHCDIVTVFLPLMFMFTKKVNVSQMTCQRDTWYTIYTIHTTFF